MTAHKCVAKPEHHAAMRDFHYRAADFYAKEATKSRGEKRAKLLRDAAAALDLAEQHRVALAESRERSAA